MTSSSPISFDSSEQTPDNYMDGAPSAWAYCDEEGNVSNGFNNFVDTYLSACISGKNAANEEAQTQDEGKDKKEGEVVTIEVNYSQARGDIAKKFEDEALATLKIPALCHFLDPDDAAPRNRSETIVEEDKEATNSASEAFEDSMNGMVCGCPHSLVETPSQWSSTEVLPEPPSLKMRNLAVGSLRRLFRHQLPADYAAAQGGSNIGIEDTKLTISKSPPATVSATTTAITGPDIIGISNQPPLPARTGLKMAKNAGAPMMDDQLDARYKNLEEGTKLKAIRAMNGQIEYVEENDIPVPAEHITRLQDEARYEKMKFMGLPMTAAQIAAAPSQRMPRSDPSIVVESGNDLQVTSLPSSSARIRNFLFRGRQRGRNVPTPPSMPPNPNNDPSSPSGPRLISQHDLSEITLEATLVEDAPEIPLYDAVQVQDEATHTKWRKYQLCIAGVGLGLLLGIGLASAVGVPLVSNSKNDASISALTTSETSPIDPALLPSGTPSHSSSTTEASFPSETPPTHPPSLPSGSPSYSQRTEWSSRDVDQEGEDIYGDASNDAQLDTLHLGQH